MIKKIVIQLQLVIKAESKQQKCSATERMMLTYLYVTCDKNTCKHQMSDQFHP